MINDLQTECTAIKYVDDTTIYHTSNNPSDNSLQESVDTAIDWSKQNSMKINATKTKDMLVSFSRDTPTVHNITVDGDIIERVSECKLLGVILNNRLSWHDHIDAMMKKANTRLHFLCQLKRTKLPAEELIKVYVTLIRPLLEYACQVWHAGLNDHQTNVIDSVQERVLNMVYPGLCYNDALAKSGLPTLGLRRNAARRNLFIAMQEPDHKLHHLLPPKRPSRYSSRNGKVYALPATKTNRFKDSFVPYCLYNF